jgi:hypothetical protein
MKKRTHAFLICLACVFFSSCQPPEKFEFFELGALSVNNTYTEYAIPNHKGDFVSISGMLDRNQVNYREFLDSYRFHIQCHFQDGSIKHFENFIPREASWHGTDCSFVIFSEIDEPREGKIVRVKVQVLREIPSEISVEEKIVLKLYVGAI